MPPLNWAIPAGRTADVHVHPGMACNRRMFESVVVGYDTYVQTEEVFEQHRPIVDGDELVIDVELTSVRRIAGRDLITVTNTFTDAAGERVHTLHHRRRGDRRDINPEVKAAVQKAMMHDVDILGIGASADDYHKTVRPEAEVRIANDAPRNPGTPSFDELQVGDELPVHHTVSPAATWSTTPVSPETPTRSTGMRT